MSYYSFDKQTSIIVINNKSPYEILYKQKPHFLDLRAFICFSLSPPQKLTEVNLILELEDVSFFDLRL